MQKLKALKVLENMVTDAFEDSEVKIVLFGSRARGDYVNTSDIDIGILPKGIINKRSRKCFGNFARGAERTLLCNCERRHYTEV